MYKELKVWQKAMDLVPEILNYIEDFNTVKQDINELSRMLNALRTKILT